MNPGNQQLTVKEMAAFWAMRLTAEDCGPADRAAFTAWYDAHQDNALAFDRTERALRTVDRHMGHPELEAMSQQALAETAPRRSLPTRWIAAGIASSVMLAASVSIITMGYLVPATPTEAEHAYELYDTAVGERSTVTLSDGSTMTLNTNSRVAVEFDSNIRMVTMQRGQAFFEVASDHTRPFAVNAGNQRITAIGTAFDVRFDKQDEVRVVLVEGQVAVDEIDPRRPFIEQTALPDNRIEMAAGDALLTSSSSGPELRQADIEEATSWRSGRLVFRDESLIDAVAEVNRYSIAQLRLDDDPRLVDVTVSGVFNIGRPDSFVRALESVHAIEARRSSDNDILLTWRD